MVRLLDSRHREAHPCGWVVRVRLEDADGAEVEGLDCRGIATVTVNDMSGDVAEARLVRIAYAVKGHYAEEAIAALIDAGAIGIVFDFAINEHGLGLIEAHLVCIADGEDGSRSGGGSVGHAQILG
jgi:hypothetical protein